MIRAQHAIDFLPAKFRDRPARDNYPREVRSFHRSIARNRHTPFSPPFSCRDARYEKDKRSINVAMESTVPIARERESGAYKDGTIWPNCERGLKVERASRRFERCFLMTVNPSRCRERTSGRDWGQFGKNVI